MNKQKIKPIDVNILQERLESIYNSILCLYHDGYEYGEKDGIAECILELQSMPIVDLENLKPLGKWIKNQIGEDGYSHTICSECKTEAPFHYSYEEYYDEGMDGEWEFCGLKESGISEVLSNYCPNYGVKMEV